MLSGRSSQYVPKSPARLEPPTLEEIYSTDLSRVARVKPVLLTLLLLLAQPLRHHVVHVSRRRLIALLALVALFQMAPFFLSCSARSMPAR